MTLLRLFSAFLALGFLAGGCDRTSPPPAPTHPSDAGKTSDADGRDPGRRSGDVAEHRPGGQGQNTSLKTSDTSVPPRLPDGVSDKVASVLRHVDRHDTAPAGHEGGRTFENRERRLPARDDAGRPVQYREWDVNPHRPGVNRGAERLITGTDGSAWYTDDHYRTFKRIR